MTPQPALPLSPADRARLRALHLADQAAAASHERLHGVLAVVGFVAALVLLLCFTAAGAYSVAAAHGAVPAAPWSALGR